MTKEYWFLLLLLLTLLSPFKLTAQDLESCALNRLKSETRLAIATPQQVERMNQYDITFYGLDLQLERNSVYIAGTVTLEAKLKVASLDIFAFELHPNFSIDALEINGVPQHSFSRSGSDVSVKLTTSINAPNIVKAKITYKGSAPQDARAAIGNGFSTGTAPTWGNQVTWSLSEPYAAYEWWPTKQVLTDKADSVHVFVTTSAENKVGSNGLLTKTVNLPNAKKRYEWKSRYPIAYYLVSVAVSDYDEYLISANPAGAPAPVPILNYIYKGSLNRFKNEIDLTAPLLEHFSSLFTIYPFAREKYGHSMAPMGGGMEHQTMTTQASFNFTLTAHELAHQWFGDNVTCASWKDIWLNEGFASYAEFLALQQFKPQDAAPWMLNAHRLAMDSPNGSVRVSDTTNVSRIFDYRLTYKKGASLVHMLRYEVNNDSLFFEALKNYQKQYGNSNASTDDLKKVFEHTTGLPLDYFFRQWYEGTGYPVFAVEWNQAGRNILLATTQSTSGATDFFKTHLDYRIGTASIDTIVRVAHNKPMEQHLITLPDSEPVISITVDPSNWVLNTTSKITKNAALDVPDAMVDEPVLFPNPAHTTLRVTNLSFTATTAIVYDRIGRKLLTQQLQKSKAVEINIRELPAGLYIIQLSNSKNLFSKSFIKMDKP